MAFSNPSVLDLGNNQIHVASLPNNSFARKGFWPITEREIRPETLVEQRKGMLGRKLKVITLTILVYFAGKS